MRSPNWFGKASELAPGGNAIILRHTRRWRMPLPSAIMLPLQTLAISTRLSD
jgi:hypothetical protein